MKNCRLKIFCDFDGTVTKNDVWFTSLARFVENKDMLKNITDDFVAGKINVRDVTELHLRLISGFREELFRCYLDEEEIDESFPRLIEYCGRSGDDIFVVSSGLEFYVSYILMKHSISVPHFGTGHHVDYARGTIKGVYNHADEYCENCAMCKRNILLANSSDLAGEVSVYIGDGASDFCVSRYADVVFAKGRLASHCWKNNITYYEFKTFDDIIKKLEKLRTAGKLRHRQEAAVRRKDAFLGG